MTVSALGPAKGISEGQAGVPCRILKNGHCHVYNPKNNATHVVTLYNC